MKLTYWIADHLEDNRVYSIREKKQEGMSKEARGSSIGLLGYSRLTN